jgi:hypothetical protein
MEYIYTFESFINKIEEGLIKSYDINKTLEDLNRTISIYNLDFNLNKLNNNTFELSINNFDKIEYRKETINFILDNVFNLYGWFPSKLEVINFFGAKNTFSFNSDYLFNPQNKISDIKITFEAKFDLLDKDIPKKLYHLSIQHYMNSVLKFGLITKGKSKLTTHDSRVYLCKNSNDCKILINAMIMHYSKEKDSILYSGNNPNKVYNKNTKWIIYEINTELAGIKKLYKDPNYINGYYYLNNIPKESISIFDIE